MYASVCVCVCNDAETTITYTDAIISAKYENWFSGFCLLSLSFLTIGKWKTFLWTHNMLNMITSFLLFDRLFNIDCSVIFLRAFLVGVKRSQPIHELTIWFMPGPCSLILKRKDVVLWICCLRWTAFWGLKVSLLFVTSGQLLSS